MIIEKKHREIGAFALILTKENNVLVQQRDTNSKIENSGKISMFGGSLHDNEDLLVGLRRELLEELELDIEGYKIEKFNVYKKTKELDGINHSVHVWIIYDADLNALKLHEGKAIVSNKPELILNNPKLTRVTKLALQDLIKKLR